MTLQPFWPNTYSTVTRQVLELRGRGNVHICYRLAPLTEVTSPGLRTAQCDKSLRPWHLLGTYNEYGAWRAMCVSLCVRVCVCVCACVRTPWVPRWHPSGACKYI